jgi:UDPglucose--hexose-1-phosphate uridylyltransferase
MARRKVADIIAEHAEQLLSYAERRLYLKSEDRCYIRNHLFNLLKLNEPCSKAEISEDFDFQAVLDKIVDYAVDNKIIEPNERLLFETRIMGLLTPMPSVVTDYFDYIAATESAKKACEWLYDLSTANNYIRLPDIRKNIRWEAKKPRGDIIVTINLAKPEKDPKDIAAAAKMADTGYPACALCEDNVGFFGDIKRPARQTLRIIPLLLNDEDWFFQFSPYVYFDQHCLAISKEHRPMSLNADTFVRFLDFLEFFPDYFIGSNAALPIVGGSILAHEHYQGGLKVLPLMKAPSREFYLSDDFPEVKISIVDWYNSVVRLESKNRRQIIAAASKLLSEWKSYRNEELSIIPETDGTPHNTVTPIARINDDGEWCLDMILRNNRTDSKHPYGIFHPTEDMHNIKKEGIGIIEVMGLFILPGRLLREAMEIKKILTGETPLDFKALAEEGNPLAPHIGMIAQLANDYGTRLNAEAAEAAVTDYINDTCERILDCTAVFKNDTAGRAGFSEFLNYYTSGATKRFGYEYAEETEEEIPVEKYPDEEF